MELDPEQPIVLALYANVIWRLEDWEYMLDHPKKSLAIDPNNFFGAATLIIGYEGVGDYDKWMEL